MTTYCSDEGLTFEKRTSNIFHIIMRVNALLSVIRRNSWSSHIHKPPTTLKIRGLSGKEDFCFQLLMCGCWAVAFNRPCEIQLWANGLNLARPRSAKEDWNKPQIEAHVGNLRLVPVPDRGNEYCPFTGHHNQLTFTGEEDPFGGVANSENNNSLNPFLCIVSCIGCVLPAKQTNKQTNKQ